MVHATDASAFIVTTSRTLSPTTSRSIIPWLLNTPSSFNNNHDIIIHSFPSTATTSLPLPTTTSLSMSLYKGVAKLADYSGAAGNWFTSMRVPAALIAGTSLAAFFTLVKDTADDKASSRSKRDTLLLLVYHILSLISFLLSINVIITTTATSNYLLLGLANPMANSAYELLIREVPFEFVCTRWSFYVSILSFLGCFVARTLYEFKLMVKTRIRSALLVIFSVASLFFHLLSFVNYRLTSWTNLWTMTHDLFGMFIKRALHGQGPAELLSVVTFVTSIVMAISMFQRSTLFSSQSTTSTSSISSSSTNLPENE